MSSYVEDDETHVVEISRPRHVAPINVSVSNQGDCDRLGQALAKGGKGIPAG